MIDATNKTPEEVYAIVKEFAYTEHKKRGWADPTEEQVLCLLTDEDTIQACEAYYSLSRAAATVGGMARRFIYRKNKGGGSVLPLPSMVVSASVTEGAVPLRVQYYSNASTPSAPMVRLWDFGDGVTSDATNPEHTYTVPGMYSATCTGTNARGSNTSPPITITVHATPTDIPPVAVQSASVLSGPAPLTVTFSGAGSITHAGGALLHSWDFGDLTASNNENPTKTYTIPGTYYVVHAVEDANGLTNAGPRFPIVVTAVNRPPIAVAYADKVSGVGPLTVQFSSAGSRDPDGTSIATMWRFGDGGMSTAANPAHTYGAVTVPTQYTADLTVTSDGQSAVANPITITVLPAPSGGETGWTDYSAVAPDARIVYLSASGNDANDGLTPATPKATPAAAFALMRPNFPDRIRIRRGDSISGAFPKWTKSGRSAVEPMIVETYGDPLAPRPILNTGTSSGFERSGGSGSPPRVDFVALVGVHFRANRSIGQATEAGFKWLGLGGSINVEDCVFERYTFNVSIESDGGNKGSGFRFFRCHILNAHPPGWPHSSGFYSYNSDNILVEECTLHHNGWDDSVPGGSATIFNHNIYIHGGGVGVTFRSNIIALASSHGLSVNVGTTIEDNLIVGNSVGVFARTMGTAVRRNVVTDGKDIDAGTPRGVGMVFGPRFTEGPTLPVGPLAITDNLIVRNGVAWGSSAIEVLDRSGDVGSIEIARNTIYKWASGIMVQNAPGVSSFLAVTGNVVHDDTMRGEILDIRTNPTPSQWSSGSNVYWSAAPIGLWGRISEMVTPWATVMAAIGDTTSTIVAPNFVDSTRTVGSYAASIGLAGTTAAFLEAAIENRKGKWNTAHTAAAVNAYMRAGYSRV